VPSSAPSTEGIDHVLDPAELIVAVADRGPPVSITVARRNVARSARFRRTGGGPGDDRTSGETTLAA
jgi:hypothetical protein